MGKNGTANYITCLVKIEVNREGLGNFYMVVLLIGMTDLSLFFRFFFCNYIISLIHIILFKVNYFIF